MDEHWMRRCLTLARLAQDAGDAPVGAVVVSRGILLAEAAEAVRAGGDISGHAELIAVRAACRARRDFDLSDATLYTTAEPCWMCAFPIRETGVRRVVYGLPVPDIGAHTSPHALLTLTVPGWPPPPQVTAGVLADECAALRAHDVADGL